MGTWGVHPFGSDTALDFLDLISTLSPQARLELILRTLQSASYDSPALDSVSLPEEVIAAASIVAVNLPGGEELPWNDEYEGLRGSLPMPVSIEVRTLAYDALELALPVDGWWWQSWVDTDDRSQMQSSIDSVKTVLRGRDDLV
jgi:alpha-glucosidase